MCLVFKARHGALKVEGPTFEIPLFRSWKYWTEPQQNLAWVPRLVMKVWRWGPTFEIPVSRSWNYRTQPQQNLAWVFEFRYGGLKVRSHFWDSAFQVLKLLDVTFIAEFFFWVNFATCWIFFSKNQKQKKFDS
jgi:hypothetical protein